MVKERLLIETIKKITARLHDLASRKFTGEIHFRVRFVQGGIKYARCNLEDDL